jgi:hypothetical protein
VTDVSVIGSGQAAREAFEVFRLAGHEVREDVDTDGPGRGAVILGETTGAYASARQSVEAGRHLLLASPASFSPRQLESLFAARRPKQALFLWSERILHPAHRLVRGFVRADDPTWQPRYIRHATFTSERPTPALFRWRVLEGFALVIACGGEPRTAASGGSAQDGRGGLDYLAAVLAFDWGEALVQTGLGEGIERRETVVVASERKAYIDELDRTAPLRLIDDTPASEGSSSRWVSCPLKGYRELARQQCFAFLNATERAGEAAAEAQLWRVALASLRAAEASLAQEGAPVTVIPAESAMRVIQGGGEMSVRSTAALRLVAG